MRIKTRNIAGSQSRRDQENYVAYDATLIEYKWTNDEPISYYSD